MKQIIAIIQPHCLAKVEDPFKETIHESMHHV
jgi:nitrogen regulatory protein PII